MKFRDPKTGKVFDNIVLQGKALCNSDLQANKEKAARLMGYEVIEETTDKPLSEWTLKEVIENCKKPMFCKYYCPFARDDKCSLMTVTPSKWPMPKPPRLTADELTICKLVGAKWVSRDKGDVDDEKRVYLWEEKPGIDCHGVFRTSHSKNCGWLPAKHFPSIYPGDCINVEEATT